MSIFNTVLFFVLLPFLAVAVIAGLALAAGAGRRARRYRPGRPYDFTPIWFLASPDQVRPVGGTRAHAPAIGSGVVETGAPAPIGATGGASDRW